MPVDQRTGDCIWAKVQGQPGAENLSFAFSVSVL